MVAFCNDLSHSCEGCSEMIEYLRMVRGPFSPPTVARPISLKHIAMRFGDGNGDQEHFDFRVDGVNQIGLIEAVLGEEGWIIRYAKHTDVPESSSSLKVHSCPHPYRFDPTNPLICVELVYGNVEMVLKPEAARWAVSVERICGTLYWLDRVKSGDDAALAMTTNRETTASEHTLRSFR